MPSSKEYLDYILDQLSDSEVSYRSMMGEYILYYRRKIIGGIYDDRLLVKPVPSAPDFLQEIKYERPYEGAKEMILVNETDDKAFLQRFVKAIYEELHTH